MESIGIGGSEDVGYYGMAGHKIGEMTNGEG